MSHYSPKLNLQLYQPGFHKIIEDTVLILNQADFKPRIKSAESAIYNFFPCPILLSTLPLYGGDLTVYNSLFLSLPMLHSSQLLRRSRV